MKQKLENIVNVLKTVFGTAVFVALFFGGQMFFGYVVALCIGGPVAEAICVFIYKKVAPVIIYISTCAVLLGLVIMYLANDHALTKKTGEEEKFRS